LILPAAFFEHGGGEGKMGLREAQRYSCSVPFHDWFCGCENESDSEEMYMMGCENDSDSEEM